MSCINQPVWPQEAQGSGAEEETGETAGVRPSGGRIVRPPRSGARRDIAPCGGHAHAGDLLDALPAVLRGRTGILAADVPYVPSDEVGLLPAEARDHEPLVALDGGDGLDVLRRVAAGAPEWLAPGGCVLVETSERQAEQAVDIFRRAGLASRLAVSAELYANVVTGVRV